MNARAQKLFDSIDWLSLARQQSGRFWSKVDKSGSCWIWKAGLDKDGYGKFAITSPRGNWRWL